MSILSHINPLYSLSGFVVGVLVGQTGVGGGSLMTPLLVLLFGVHPLTAVGTDLLFASVTKSAGTLVHGMNKTVDWRVTGRLAAGSVPATVLTLYLVTRFDLVGKSSASLISTILGCALILTSIALVMRRRIMAYAGHRLMGFSARKTAILTVLTGATLGVLVSISSIGAGALGVTALILLYPRLPIPTIIGSDIAHAVPLTLIAGLGHWMLGSVNGSMLVSLLVGSLPGIVLGSYLSARLPDVVLRGVLAAVLALVGVKLVF
jgi:uncharacterized membrane protein YfcA